MCCLAIYLPNIFSYLGRDPRDGPPQETSRLTPPWPCLICFLTPNKPVIPPMYSTFQIVSHPLRLMPYPLPVVRFRNAVTACYYGNVDQRQRIVASCSCYLLICVPHIRAGPVGLGTIVLHRWSHPDTVKAFGPSTRLPSSSHSVHHGTAANMGFVRHATHLM